MSYCRQAEAILDTRAPEPMCDACLADYLAVTGAQARRAAKALAAAGLARRDAGLCSGCCTHRMVSRAGMPGRCEARARPEGGFAA